MIFLKHFSVSEQTLKGVSKAYVQRNSKVGELVGTINALMGWQATTPLRLYEVLFFSLLETLNAEDTPQEIKPGMIEIMKSKMTFAQSEIQDGDVICFQVDLSDKE